MSTGIQNERLIAPRVNVVEREDAVVVEAEVPGVSREHAEIEVKDGALHITARVNGNGSTGAYRLRERIPATYYRRFQLGDTIDTAKVEASLKDGVLTVTLPKSERLRARQIAVN
jgi:HSP20 family protein